MKGFHKLFLLILLTIQGCGGGGSSSNCSDCDKGDSTSPTTQKEITFNGRVVDGPLAGARVFIDLNGNGVENANEPAVTTNEDGFFSITGPDKVNAKIIALGGIDTATGVELSDFALSIQTPSDPAALVSVNPFTTLLSQVTTEEYQILIDALGIDTDAASVSTEDHWSLAQAGNTNAMAIQRINMQIGLLMQSGNNLFNGATSNSERAAIAVAQAMSELAKTTYIDLKETESVSAILQRASSLLAPNNPMPSDILEAVAEPIASFAQVIASKDFNPTGNTAAQVTRISQQSLQTSIVDLVTGNINLEGFKQATSINELLSTVDLSLEQATLDTDGDKIPNIIDPDDDNDGVRDEDDIAPLNSKPTIELSLIVHDNEVTIKWDANDPEENAAVSLYYDVDNAGYDGKKINNTAFFEDTDSSYQWQTSWQASQLKSGNYYIYASISDGINAPVFAYADQKITISRASTINGFPIEVVYQGAPYYFKPTVDTNEKLSFSATNLPGWMDIHQTTGEITGTPDNDDVGPHNDIVISVTDILGNSASLPEFDINVMNINDRPQAYSQRIRIDENESIIFTLMGSDIDNDQLEFIIVEYPQHGLLQLDGDMATYASTSDTATEDRFTYKVSDSLLDSEIVQVAIDIRAINDVPTAQSKTVVAQEQRAQSISLVVADNDNDIEDLTISIDALPQHGTLKQDDIPIITAGTSVPASTVLTYTSDPGAESDQFTFKAHDETDSSELATVDISVSTNTDKPHISGLSDSRDFLDMNEDSELVLSVDDFEISSIQTDQSGFSLHIESPDEQANYSVTGNTIVPNDDFHGDFVVLVTVFDGELYSVPFDFKTIVLPQPDAPEISDQIFDSISENQTTIGQVHAEDPDGDNLLFELVTGSDILNITTGGVLSFKEDKEPDFETQTIYTTQVLVKDAVAGGLSDTATVTIKISNINEPPIADPIDLEVRQQVSTPIDLLGSDPENAPITYLITSLPTKGKLSDDGVILNAYPHAVNGELLYMADPLEPGLLKSTDQFTYQAVEIFSQSNNALSSEDATVSIKIKPPIPSATEIVLPIPKHLPVELALTNTNNDPDERYEITEKPTVGTLKDIQSNGVAIDINQEQLPYVLKGELVYSRSSALNEYDVITYRVVGSDQTAEVQLYDIYNHGKITYVPNSDNASDPNAPNTNNAPLITWHDSVTETVYLGSSYWNNMPRMADVDVDFCDNNDNTKRNNKNLPPNNDCVITALQKLNQLSTNPAKRLYTFRSNPYNSSQSTVLGRFVFDTPIVELNASQDCSSSFSCFVDLTWTWADGGDSNLDNLNLYYKSEDSEEILITSVNRATQELSYRWQDNIPQSGTYTIYAKVCSDIDPDDCYFKSQPTVINIGFVFTSPTAVEGSLVVEDHFNITWLSNDTVSQAQVKLYYDTDDSGYDGILIQSSLDLTGNHNWDMSLLESGTYYIYAEISDGNSTKYTYAPGALILNRAPSILFNSPVNASGESANNSFVIQWTAEDPDDQAAITLWYDTDNLDYNGIQIQTQDQLDINDSSYPWDISKLQRGDYFIYAIIDDNINEPLKTYAPGKIVINNVPTANSINVIAYQEISKKITLQGTSSYDGVLSYQIASLPEYGMLQDDNGPITSVEHIVNGELTYTSISTTATSDQFTYTAFDGETSSAASVNITIQVLEVDNPPILKPIGDINFDEDSFGTITLEVDEFDGDSFSLDVTSQAGNSSNFTITADNNQFAFKSTDNWSGEETFTATVTDQTEAAKSTSQSFKVIVNPVDDAPVIANQTFDVPENQKYVGNVDAQDSDAGDTLTFDLEGTDADAFNIDSRSGYMSFKTAPNFDDKASYSVVVKVTDDGSPSLFNRATITVNVTNINKAPVIADHTIFSNENQSFLGTINASDPDAEDTLTYALVGRDASLFNIDPNSGDLSFIVAPNFENSDQKNTYNINVKVTDNGSPSKSTTAAITIKVFNVNEIPIISDQIFNVPENQTTVGTVDAEDPDANDTLTYTLMEGSDANLFNIEDGSGDLSFIAAPDFENPNQKNTYNVNVRVSDTGNPSLANTAKITVNITNVNEPPVINDQAFNVSENQTAVGTVAAEDPDANDILTYTLVEGLDANLFNIEDVSGDLSFIAAPDFENQNQKNTYSFKVRVTDKGSPSKSTKATITVNVSDANDAPVIVSGVFYVPENQTAVGTVDAEDPDTNDTLTYTLVEGSDANLFNIEDDSGVLSFIAAPDFENPNQKNIYSVNLKVMDSGSPSKSTTEKITINVTDVNEAPVIDDQSFNITENKTDIGPVVAMDHDVGDTLEYSLSGSDASIFNIDAIGNLSFISAPDFENSNKKNTYSINVKVTDDDNQPISNIAAITVNVTDILEVDIDFQKTSSGHDGESFYQLYKNTSFVMEAEASGQEAIDISQAVFSIEDSEENIIKPSINFTEIRNSPGDAPLNKYFVELNAVELKAQTTYSLKMDLKVKDKSSSVSKKIKVEVDDGNSTRINGIAKVTNGETEINLDGLSNESELHVFDSACLNKLEHIFSDASNCNHQTIKPNGSTFSLTDNVDMKQLILKTGNYLSEVGLPFPIFNNHYLVLFKEKLWMFSNNQIWYSSDGFTWLKVSQQMDFAPNKRFGYRVVVFDDALWVLGGFSGSGHDLVIHKDVWKSEDGITWNEETNEANFISTTNPEILTHKYGDEEEKIWMIGGGYIWNSNDGVTWEQITAPENIDISHDRTRALVDKDGNLQLVGPVLDLGGSKDPLTAGYEYAGNNQWHARTPSVGPKKQDRLIIPLGGHEAINFKGDTWVVGGSCYVAYHEEYGEYYYDFEDCNYLYKLNGSFTSGYWQHVNVEETSKKAISRRLNPNVVVFDEKLWISDSNHSNHWGGISYSADGIAWLESNDLMVRPPNRTDHQVVYFKNKMWSIGGSTIGMINSMHPLASLKNDIWISEDGINWAQAQNEMPFTARRGHQAVVFENHLWLIGGYEGECKTEYPCSDYQTNDIWKSSDGINWQQIKDNADFTIREGHQVKLFNEELWLIGGYGQDQYNNEIWKSNNGEDWEQVQIIDGYSSFSARSGHQLVVFGSHLWLIGGFDGSTYKNDIWRSHNGKYWQEVTPSASIFSPRSEHQVSVFEGKLWLTGGKNTDGVVADDIWFSIDGTNWEQYQSSHKPSSKEGHQMLTFDDGTQEQLRLIGGAAGIDHSDGGALDETWSYQLSDEQWTRYMHITTPYPTGLQ